MSAAIEEKILVLIRHAKAVSSYGAYKDIERPLTVRGTEEAKAMAGWLHEKLSSLRVSADLLLVSAAQRTVETADIFATIFEKDSATFQLDPQLYLPTIDSIYASIEKVADSVKVLCIFSHNNGITDFANTLTNYRIDVIPPCGVVVLKVQAGSWKNIRAAKKVWVGFNAPGLSC